MRLFAEHRARGALVTFVVMLGILSAAATALGAAAVKVPFITHWWNEPGVKDFLNDSKRAFETENPGIVIEPIAVPFDQLIPQILAKLPTSAPPGIVYSWLGVFPSLVDTGLLTPLNKYVEHAGITERLDAPALRNATDAGGNIMAMPLQMSCEAFVYNRKLLEEAGVGVPSTLQELLQAARATTDTRTRQYGIGLLTVPSGLRMYTKVWNFIVASGGNLASDGRPTVNSTKVIEGINLYKQFVDEGLTPVGVNEQVLRELFAQGRIAMIIDVPVLLTITQGANPQVYKNVAVGRMPTPGHRGAALSVVYLSIPKNFPHPDEAWKFLEFLQRPEWVKRFITTTRMTHASKQPVPSDLLAEYPWIAGYADQKQFATNAAPPGLERYSSEFQGMMINFFQEALSGREPVEDVMSRAQAEMERWLAAKAK